MGVRFWGAKPAGKLEVCLNIGQPKSNIPISKPFLRFGDALAGCRTLHAKRIVRKANKFLRSAKGSGATFNTSSRLNRAWIAGANLQPVLDFLAGK